MRLFEVVLSCFEVVLSVVLRLYESVALRVVLSVALSGISRLFCVGFEVV